MIGGDGGEIRLVFPRDTYALALRAARLYRRMGDPRAASEATKALSVITDTDDPIRRHHVLGAIDATAQDLDELDAMVNAFGPAS